MIKARGYCTRNFCSLEGGYYCKPTPLQKASYGLRVVQAVRASNEALLGKLLRCGLSPNPCNDFGESIVHMACRRGDSKLLRVLVQAGCCLQVTDDFGRTPLHDACWTAEPNFSLVEIILNADERLLHIVDCRGSSPLSYVKRDHWSKWIGFFESKKDVYWKPRNVQKDGEEGIPPLVAEAPHSRPIKDPAQAAPLQVAKQLASGTMEPDVYLVQRQHNQGTAPTQCQPQPPQQQPQPPSLPSVQQQRSSSSMLAKSGGIGLRLSKSSSITAALGIPMATTTSSSSSSSSSTTGQAGLLMRAAQPVSASTPN